MVKLNNLQDNAGAYQNSKRVGRGAGSGVGKTSKRGQKGQKSRSGVAIKGFEGGQMPIYRRLPKRGFNSLNAKEFDLVNLGRLQAAIDAGKLDASQEIDAIAMAAAGLGGRAKDGFKILGEGELTAKVVVKAAKASKSAVEAIEKSGGSFEAIVKKKPAAAAADTAE